MADDHQAVIAENCCPKCGGYMPLTLDGTRRVHECHRTPPFDLPHGVCACPVCGGYAPGRFGCWGTTEDPHPHAYMVPIHELVNGSALASLTQRLQDTETALRRSENDWVFLFNVSDGVELRPEVRRALARANLDAIRAALAAAGTTE